MNKRLRYLEDDSFPAPRSRERCLRDLWWYGGKAVTDFAALKTCNPRKFMTPAECRKFDQLPDEFTVYRGYQSDPAGESWTLLREVAEAFAVQRPDLPPGEVITRRIKKSEVFAYLDTPEQEIIILEA